MVEIIFGSLGHAGAQFLRKSGIDLFNSGPTGIACSFGPSFGIRIAEGDRLNPSFRLCGIF
jgi:hypothetical protein